MPRANGWTSSQTSVTNLVRVEILVVTRLTVSTIICGTFQVRSYTCLRGGPWMTVRVTSQTDGLRVSCTSLVFWLFPQSISHVSLNKEQTIRETWVHNQWPPQVEKRMMEWRSIVCEWLGLPNAWHKLIDRVWIGAQDPRLIELFRM
jgi:hypothetical protein